VWGEESLWGERGLEREREREVVGTRTHLFAVTSPPPPAVDTVPIPSSYRHRDIVCVDSGRRVDVTLSLSAGSRGRGLAEGCLQQTAFGERQGERERQVVGTRTHLVAVTSPPPPAVDTPSRLALPSSSPHPLIVPSSCHFLRRQLSSRRCHVVVVDKFAWTGSSGRCVWGREPLGRERVREREKSWGLGRTWFL
jgi:hypothetical protein